MYTIWIRLRCSSLFQRFNFTLSYFHYKKKKKIKSKQLKENPYQKVKSIPKRRNSTMWWSLAKQTRLCGLVRIRVFTAVTMIILIMALMRCGFIKSLYF